MTNKSIWITVAILLLYFIPFTSGLYYWASKSQETRDLIVPFSWALSARDTGLTGVAMQDDLNCAEWLLNDSDKDIKIVCDSNAIYLISGHTELIPDAWEAYGREDRLATMFGTPRLDTFYMFLTEWNVKHQGYIETVDVGLRRKWDLMIYDNCIEYMSADLFTPEPYTQLSIKISVESEEVYRSGDAVVYLCKYRGKE